MTGGAVEKATGEGEGLTVVSTAPLPLLDVFVLLQGGIAPSQWNGRVERQTDTDVTDEQIARLL